MMRIDPKHGRAALIAVGSAAIITAVGLTLGPGEEEAGNGIELVGAPPPAASSQPIPDPAPEAVAPPAPAAASASLEGIRLHGLLSDGAVIALAGGGQKLVRLGREVLPGFTLAEVRQDRVLLAQGDRMVELGFGTEAASSGRAAGEAGQEEAPTPAPAVSSAAGDARRQALEYRLGLAPRRVGGRTSGFALRPGASLPMLQRAGLRSGDVILSVNGQSFDSEEKVLELPLEIAGSYTAVFEFEREGRRMTASLPVNPRP